MEKTLGTSEIPRLRAPQSGYKVPRRSSPSVRIVKRAGRLKGRPATLPKLALASDLEANWRYRVSA